MSFRAYFDGAVQPHNPGGHGGYGLIVHNGQRVVHSEAVYVGRWPSLSNNCTEYAGAIAALRYCLREGITEGVIYGDADMIIRQLNGQWRVKQGAYVPYYREAYALRVQVPNVHLEWIPRERNGDADDLSKRAVLSQPRIIGFHLNESVESVPAPRITKAHTRLNRRLRVEAANDDEAWQQFKIRYGDL
jgi:ribonuclease HI